ncbi:MAG TPA: hypothetical protein DCF45_01525 [Gammaproteobacteria bacterium]|nr:hypothetical protein [Gammaproteobacteria bacterium]
MRKPGIASYSGLLFFTANSFIRGLALIAALIFASSVDARDADMQPLHGAIAGYSAGGMISALGEGLTAMVRAEFPGSSLTYEPGNPAGGLVKMVAGKRPFSIQTPMELAIAQRGEKPFRRAYSAGTEGDFTAIAQIVEGMAVQVLMREGFFSEHRISDFQQVIDRQLPLRVSANIRGNLLGQVLTERILNYYGLSYEQLRHSGGEVVYLATRASADLMRNRKLDMVVTAAFLPSARLIEIATATDIRLLYLPPDLVATLADEFGFTTMTIPADTYPFLHRDLPSMTTGFLLTAGRETGFNVAYQMARSLHRQFDQLRQLHPAFADFEPEMLLRTAGIPLHPGAQAYYKEAGLALSGTEVDY